MHSFVHIPKSLIDETLAQEPQQGKRELEPLKAFSKQAGIAFNILEDSQVENNQAEVHQEQADLWLCLEGEVAFICSGEMNEPRFRALPDGSENQKEIYAETISGGTEVVLKAGDWLWIPAGVPHQHNTSDTARLIIIKIPKT